MARDSSIRTPRLTPSFETVPAERNVVEHDEMLTSHALTHEVVDRQRGKHPVLHSIFTQHLLVADIVAITVSAVTVNVDAKDIFDGILVAVKCCAAQRQPVAHVGPHPSGVDVRQRNLSSTVDGVDQPDVFSK